MNVLARLATYLLQHPEVAQVAESLIERVVDRVIARRDQKPAAATAAPKE